MAKRFGYRTAIAGLTTVALLAPGIHAPVAVAETSSSNQTQGATKQHPTSDTSSEFTSKFPKLQVKLKDDHGHQFWGGVIGLSISLAGLLGSQFQIHGIKELNTQIQKQIGIFDPKLAAQMDNTIGKVGGLLGAVGVIGSIVAIATAFKKQEETPKSQAETFNAEAVKDFTITVGAAAPAAKELIANADQLPAGTTFEAVPAIDTTEPGNKTANIFVKYPDGSRKLVTVPFQIVTASEANTPQPKQDVKIVVGATAPDAKDLIANADDLPAGTTFEAVPAINTETAGKKTANVFVKYPDGSRELVTVPVTVAIGDAAKNYEPEAKRDITVEYDSTNADPTFTLAQLIENADELPTGTKVKITDKINTNQPGVKDVTAYVIYPDGSLDFVTVSVTVTADPDNEGLPPEFA